MSDTYQDLLENKRRLTLLRFLSGRDNYELNTSVLKTIINQSGFAVSTDELSSDIERLVEAKCVTTRNVEGMTVVRLTTRGDDVSKGLTKSSIVARPSPD